MMGRILFYLIITTCSQIITASPTGVSPQNTTDVKPVHEKDIGDIQNTTSDTKTIEELVKQQTETVKKIVADHKQHTSQEYPVITKLEPQYTDDTKKEIEKLSLEQLKIKCQHLSRLFNLNKTSENKPTYHGIIGSPTRYANHKPLDLTRRPVYIQPKPTYRPKYTTTPKPNGFFITTQSTSTKKPVNTQPAPIKYIRLEPVILQKTILSDGRTVYYWHRSLPTAVELAQDPTQNNHVSNSPSYPYSSNDYISMHNGYGNTPYSYAQNAYIAAAPNSYVPAAPNSYALAAQNSYGLAGQNSYAPAYPGTYSTTIDTYVDDKKPIEATTESSTTSTTEQTSYSGYSFGSFLPFYSYRQDSTTTTTTEPTTTTTTTTTPSPTEKLKPDELLYAQQLRFVIPVPYENVNGGASTSARHPWDFDPYAYYPKELQPNTMNVQVPYSPTYHMIRAVAVPNSEGNYENIDQVKV